MSDLGCHRLFIMVTTAATLNAPGITKIETAAQAAEALRPIAGELTFLLFAIGIIGTGLLAVPVLAGSAAYAVAETFGLPGSLELPASRALGFYAIVGAATLAGGALAATNIDPIVMFFWTAVINGIVAVPIMMAMMLVVSGHEGEKNYKFAAMGQVTRMAGGGADGTCSRTACMVKLLLGNGIAH